MTDTAHDPQIASLRQRIIGLLDENRKLAAAHAAAEQRLGQLATLNAAVRQLHEAGTPNAVLTTIKEIVANLLGSEEMGIYARHADGTLRLLDGIGVDAARWGTIPSGFAEVRYAAGAPTVGDPVACVPLLMNGQALGAVVVFRLLPQKPLLEPVDRELCALLSTHAGLALHHAELRASAAQTEAA